MLGADQPVVLEVTPDDFSGVAFFDCLHPESTKTNNISKNEILLISKIITMICNKYIKMIKYLMQ